MRGIDFSRLETWLHGLLAAAIVAGSSTGGALLTSYIGQTAVNWHQLWVSMGISSLIAAFFYLKSSPLPTLSVTSTTTTTVSGSLNPTVDKFGNVTIDPSNPTDHK